MKAQQMEEPFEGLNFSRQQFGRHLVPTAEKPAHASKKKWS
jgi:hypothetical protein